MAKAQIALQDGIVVTIEGTPEEVVSVVARLQAPAKPSPSPVERGISKAATGKATRSGKMQLTDLISSMIDEGFFGTPKGLGAVRAGLAERGHHYPVTSLSGAMLRLVKGRKVRRMKQDKVWVYAQ